MIGQRTDRNDGYPRDELRPELRRVVDGIARETPPQDLIERALDKARRRVASEAAQRPGFLDGRRMRRFVLWNLVVAASVGAVALALVLRPIPWFQPNAPPPVVLPPPQVAAAPDLPTAWAYHQALGQSPEALEALLDRHAKQSLSAEPPSFQANVFSRSSQPML